MSVLFPTGVQGLSDTKWQGAQGQVHRLVGIDYRSTPGIIKVNQKLTKMTTGEVVDELCKVAVPVSDGSTLWFSSVSGKIWREVSGTFTLVHTTSIPAWDLTTTTAPGTSYNITAQINNPAGGFFKADGLTFYMLDDNDIYQYTLTEAFDISTASYASKTFDLATQCANAQGMWIRADGIKLFVTDGDDIYRYTLATPFDISTASYDTHTSSFAAQDSDLVGLGFKSDGTVLIVTGRTNDKFYQYTLATPWDLTTKSFVDDFAIGNGVDFHTAAYISPDGDKMFVLGSNNPETVYQYSLATPWSMTTAQDDGISYSVAVALPGISAGLMFDPAGRHFYITSGSSETVYQYDLAAEDLNVATLSAEEFSVPAIDAEETDPPTPYIYYTTKNYLLRVPVANIDDWDGFEYITAFTYGDDTYHPMKKQNNRLFIGDKYVIAEVNESGVVTLETDFNVQAPERITTLGIIDTDLLVGTKETRRSWVKRWDTEALSWFAQDWVEETEIYGFLPDDNYVYVIAGDFGRVYFYDGEKMHKEFRVPGEYSMTQRSKVNQNAIASFFGVPIFGVSNLEGNPSWQGLYSYGRFSKDYNVTLDLSYPLSCDEFADIEIGAIIVQGYDLLVCWSNGDEVAVDKIDWTAKYESAFIETMVLNSAKDRSKFKSITEILADYYRLPENTGIDFSIENNYNGFVEISDEKMIKKAEKLNQIQVTSTQKELGAVCLMFEFEVNGNECPEMENFHANFAGEK